MKELTKVCILTGLVLALSLSSALGQFGSKVVTGDADVGRFLEDFPAPLNPNLGYWDTGSNPGIYDDGDTIYLDFLGNGIIDANDIRLTDYSGYLAGSKVMSADNDINKPLSPLPGQAAGIYYADLYGSQGYDIQDPVYVLAMTPAAVGARTATKDVRLGPVLGLSPGTKVLNYHPDNDGPAIPMIVPVAGGAPVATLRFYNANGNVDGNGDPIYDFSDDVYIDVSLPSVPMGGFPFGFVVPNNVRLSA
ncbi:hypothetical protein [Methanocrinis sp.]|uniref:hypothetical protein n=1 Tax=Methanocrinis sp. TaxID=3101522 RepID=UPI003D09A2C0